MSTWGRSLLGPATALHLTPLPSTRNRNAAFREPGSQTNPHVRAMDVWWRAEQPIGWIKFPTCGPVGHEIPSNQTLRRVRNAHLRHSGRKVEG
ncbi:hypothetical protein KRM28CT15_22420 [Krasilnikovia sp. M28-CT-15]